ncbi:MAG: hypothetical protein J5993_00145 [Clostridia bacterium]|nr:hypothetical protein [Clostridia bacterium]
MKIKTRESLKTIKTFDRADTLAQKSKSGISSLHNSAEQTQNIGYESETDYAGSELQDKEERIARMAVVGANKVGRWGVKETRKNIHKWRNRPRKPKPNLNLKQLPSPQRPMLEAPKKGIKTASKAPKKTVKGTKTAVKGAKTTAKATVKGTKAAVKGTVKAAQLIKKAAIATVKFVKVAVKAIIAAAKATVAAIKGIIAAIVAGGWVAVLIIVIIVIVALVVGSVYAIFVPAEDSEITIYSVKTDLEREYHQRQAELIANCQYDILNYEGDIAAWDEMIAVYAVKLNLGDEPQEVATFDEDKAAELKAIFWDMNSISLRTESRTTTVTRYETNADGELVEVQEDVTMIILTVVTDSMSADEISDEYGFSTKQDTMLDELLSEENSELWAGILGE